MWRTRQEWRRTLPRSSTHIFDHNDKIGGNMPNAKAPMRLFATVATGLVALLAHPLQASAADAAAAAAPATVEEVVVTGSYIAGTPETAALPVNVITADTLQKRGNPNIIET